MSIKENEKISNEDGQANDMHSEVIELKSFSIDASEGMMCDFNTGVCGPVNEETEDEK